MLLKTLSCQNNSKNYYTKSVAKRESSGWAIFTNCSFDATKNKLDYYREIDCIKELCKKLKDHALKIINYEKKEMIPLSEEENKSYESKMYATHANKSFIQTKTSKTRKMRMIKIKSTKKLKIIFFTLENLEVLLIIIVI